MCGHKSGNETEDFMGMGVDVESKQIRCSGLLARVGISNQQKVGVYTNIMIHKNWHLSECSEMSNSSDLCFLC